jgi:hypothetical protein
VEAFISITCDVIEGTASPLHAAGARQQYTSSLEKIMTDAAHVAGRYIAVWNETDPTRRSALLAEGWSADATYVDPLMSGRGLDQIGALIGAVHARFPGFRFTLVERADGYGDNVRFSWALGPKAEPEMIKGTDVAVTENGRLKSVTGFIDKAPAGA